MEIFLNAWIEREGKLLFRKGKFAALSIDRSIPAKIDACEIFQCSRATGQGLKPAGEIDPRGREEKLGSMKKWPPLFPLHILFIQLCAYTDDPAKNVSSSDQFSSLASKPEPYYFPLCFSIVINLNFHSNNLAKKISYFEISKRISLFLFLLFLEKVFSSQRETSYVRGFCKERGVRVGKYSLQGRIEYTFYRVGPRE